MDTVQSLGYGCVFLVEQSFVSMTAMSAEAEHQFPCDHKEFRQSSESVLPFSTLN